MLHYYIIELSFQWEYPASIPLAHSDCKIYISHANKAIILNTCVHGAKMAPKELNIEPMQIEGGKRDETEDDPETEVEAQALPFYKLLSYADGLDWVLMVLGTLGSIVHGLAQPIGYMLLGRALDAFGNNMGNTDNMVKALYKVCYASTDLLYYPNNHTDKGDFSIDGMEL